MTNSDLHGSAPDSSKVALLLIDVINPLEFDRGPEFLEKALEPARRIARLKRQARAKDIPVIYANDNFGKWRSDFRAILNRTLDSRGRELAKILEPEPDDYFVLKPKHSAFFSTTLDTLLKYLGTEALIMAGFQSHICILFSAVDAYMRDIKLWVPSDCVASYPEEMKETALQQIETTLKGSIRPFVRPLTESRRGRRVQTNAHRDRRRRVRRTQSGSRAARPSGRSHADRPE